LRGRFVIGEHGRNPEAEIRRDLLDADGLRMAAPSFVSKADGNRVVLGECLFWGLPMVGTKIWNRKEKTASYA